MADLRLQSRLRLDWAKATAEAHTICYRSAYEAGSQGARTSSIVWPPAALSSQRKGKTIGLGSFALGTRRCAWSMAKLGAEYFLSRCSTSVRPWLRARPAPWPISWPAKPSGNSRMSWRCACDCAGVWIGGRLRDRGGPRACPDCKGGVHWWILHWQRRRAAWLEIKSAYTNS